MNLKQKTEILMAIRAPRMQRNRGRSPMMRRNVLRRANGKCEVCACSILDILHLHHIRPVAKGGVSEIINLILICPNCHALAHLCARVLSAGNGEDAAIYALGEAGIDAATAEKLVLIGTEQAMVTYAGNIVPRPQDEKLVENIISDELKGTTEPVTVGD